ncbi:MAG: hypothetical protein M9888_06000 [Chitinophagales bacterium]|nr:hypothetical protein [Chitinophagales bacterium]
MNLKVFLQSLEKLLKRYSFFFGLIFLTLVIKEIYPFSMYDMYNKFPNESYAYYLTDENKQTISHQFGVSSGGLGHILPAEFTKLKIDATAGKATSEELKLIGKSIIENLLKKQDNSGLPDKIYLNRIYNYMGGEGEQIVSDTIIMIEYAIR